MMNEKSFAYDLPTFINFSPLKMFQLHIGTRKGEPREQAHFVSFPGWPQNPVQGPSS